MNKVVINIEKKVLKIISLYDSVRKEKEEILSQNLVLKSDLSERKEEIKRLEEKINLLRITKSIVTQDVEKNKESRQKINEYVREIDKCIALLNK
jgi:predicted nuclease with TOPRIM domain